MPLSLSETCGKDQCVQDYHPAPSGLFDRKKNFIESINNDNLNIDVGVSFFLSIGPGVSLLVTLDFYDYTLLTQAVAMTNSIIFLTVKCF